MADKKRRKTWIRLTTEGFPAIVSYMGKWLLICLLIGAGAGSASAIFLISLEKITAFREAEPRMLWLLPLIGLIVGWIYHRFGQSVSRGNNQILEEFYAPQKVIPFRMAPLVLFGTLATHLGGGSAGREGTAVQMGSAIADQLTSLLSMNHNDRRILLICGMSAGFASVFGTPLAGAVFALEVLLTGRVRYQAILPSLLAAILGHQVCLLWGVHHVHYSIPEVPDFKLHLLFLTLIAGVLFGLSARLFSGVMHLFGDTFKTLIPYLPLRTMAGGVVLAFVFFAIGTRYAGLGIPVIAAAFESAALPYDFLLKILLTAFTLSAGFRGGEVTPLFFIGATLGSALSVVLDLPVGLLAGMGFVAVFSGATNTPIACTLMGIELFGSGPGVYLAIACIIAYLLSGHAGIYRAQTAGRQSHFLFGHLNRHKLKVPQKKSDKKSEA